MKTKKAQFGAGLKVVAGAIFIFLLLLAVWLISGGKLGDFNKGLSQCSGNCVATAKECPQAFVEYNKLPCKEQASTPFCCPKTPSS